jgi:septin 7
MSTSTTRSKTSALTTAPDANSSPVPLGTGTASVGRVITPDRADVTIKELLLSGTDFSQIASPNGFSAPPDRASPVPQGVPNGKPTSPLVATSNSMANGGENAPQTVTSKDPKAVAAAASDLKNIVRRKLTGYVGFANLPNQWHRKSVRKGFNFNVMVVGECRTSDTGEKKAL